MRRMVLTALCGIGCAQWQPAPATAAARVVSGPRAIIEPAIVQSPRLRIVATNDFHGALEPRPDTAGVLRGGAGAVAATIKAAEAGC